MLKRALLAAVLLVGMAVPAARAGGAGADCDWPMFGHDAGRSFAAPKECVDITPANVTTLAPKWYFHAPDAVSASPAIVDGKVYVGDWAGNFYRFDAATGALAWPKPFVVDDTSHVGFGRIVSSAAVTHVGDHDVVLFGGGATLYALDAATGEQLASVCVDPRALPDHPEQRCHDPDGPEVEIESSPAVVPVGPHHVDVVVGMDVHNDSGVGRAGVVKFELEAGSDDVTLTPTWKFDPDARQAYSGPGLLTEGSGGGSGCADVWGSPAVDPVLEMVFFGTGSCSKPDDARDTGEHVWGISLHDGAFVWTQGPHGADGVVDDDFGGALNLLGTDKVGAGSKDGWYYTFDRATGAPGWSTHVGQWGHATPGFAVGGILASPATGFVNDEPAVFIATAISTPNDKPLSSGPDTAPPSVLDDPQRMLSLHAISSIDGRILWRSAISRQAYGAPTYVNGVVLIPSTFDFSMVAVDANTGLTLAQRPLPGPPSSAPTAVGDTVYGGIGTSTEEGSPLAPLSGVYAFQVVGP